MRRLFPILSALALLAVAMPANAEPGRLDPFFSGDGRQTAFRHGATAYAVAIDQKDRIVVAGYTLTAETDLAIARFLPNGRPDPDFGGDGRVRTDLGATEYAFDLAIDARGRIVVAGERDTRRGSRALVVRYGPHGSLDRRFSNDGRVFIDFGRKYQGANAIDIGASGRIVVGGFASNGSTSRWAVARLMPGGNLDRSFSRDGTVTTELSATNAQIQDLEIVRKGRIAAVGYAEAGLVPRFALARYLTGGTLDREFSSDGRAFTNVSAGPDIAFGLAVQPADGALVVVGSASNGGTAEWAVARYGPKGRPDETFDGDGKLIQRFGPGYEFAYAAAVQANGKIVVVGRAQRGGQDDFVLLRYKPGGGLDLAFGREGRMFTDFFERSDTARDVALQSNGKIVVVGEAEHKRTRRMAAARYHAG